MLRVVIEGRREHKWREREKYGEQAEHQRRHGLSRLSRDQTSFPSIVLTQRLKRSIRKETAMFRNGGAMVTIRYLSAFHKLQRIAMEAQKGKVLDISTSYSQRLSVKIVETILNLSVLSLEM